MSKPSIKINFSDFWKTFNQTDNYFVRLLSLKYTVELSNEPDLLIYSCYDNQGRLPWRKGSRPSKAQEFKRYKCIRVFYAPENVRPDFKECDYAFTFDLINHPNHYRLPYYAVDRLINEFCSWRSLHPDTHPLIKPNLVDVDQILASKTKFCNFVFSNRHAEFRDRFFQKLSKYKQIDSGGKHLNNLGYCVQDKISFLNDYKFTIAFENASTPGYVTEKIVHPMLVNSIPIYWGNPLIDKDFNSKSFLNYQSFSSENDLIEYIVEIDRDDDLYSKYLSQPWFFENRVNSFIDPKNVLSQFEKIIETQKTPIAQQRRWFRFF
jgi:hypothetical protein